MSAISIRVYPVEPEGAHGYPVEREAALVDRQVWVNGHRGCALLTRDLALVLPARFTELNILRTTVG